jgi:hypothetical protein
LQDEEKNVSRITDAEIARWGRYAKCCHDHDSKNNPQFCTLPSKDLKDVCLIALEGKKAMAKVLSIIGKKPMGGTVVGICNDAIWNAASDVYGPEWVKEQLAILQKAEAERDSK